MPISEGIYWLRMPLPFRLGHINLWLLEDGDGRAVIDTGVHTNLTRDIWNRLLATFLHPGGISRILVTHLHPDHAGCAGWLARETGADLWMPREEYLLCRVLTGQTGPAPESGADFYRAAGFSTPELEHYRRTFGMFGRLVSTPPDAYRRLADGDRCRIGRHQWEVIIGRGHSPEHACLFCEDLGLFISGDQLLPEISSNVSVWPTEPAGDPLGEWLDSLARLERRLPEDVLVLPSHGAPFRGARPRLAELMAKHRERLAALEAACRSPRRAVDLFTALFRGAIDDDNLVMATGETLAHLNYLIRRGRVQAKTDDDGVRWYRST